MNAKRGFNLNVTLNVDATLKVNAACNRLGATLNATAAFNWQGALAGLTAPNPRTSTVTTEHRQTQSMMSIYVRLV